MARPKLSAAMRYVLLTAAGEKTYATARTSVRTYEALEARGLITWNYALGSRTRFVADLTEAGRDLVAAWRKRGAA